MWDLNWNLLLKVVEMNNSKWEITAKKRISLWGCENEFMPNGKMAMLMGDMYDILREGLH